MNKPEIQALEAKIRRFAGELTPDEQKCLRATRTQLRDVTGLMSSPLWDKARQVAGTLTTEEQEQIRLLLAAVDDGADAEGFRVAAYEDEYGYKGKPGTGSPPSGWSDGERTAGYITVAATLLIIAGFL